MTDETPEVIMSAEDARRLYEMARQVLAQSIDLTLEDRMRLREVEGKAKEAMIAALEAPFAVKQASR